MAGNNSYPTPSGTISMSNINSALGQSSTASISFSDSRVRFLANQDSGSVSMSNMRNKFYSDGTLGPVTYYDDGKGTQSYAANTSPNIFGAGGAYPFSYLYYDINYGQNQLGAAYWGSNIGLAGRSFRVQISNGVTFSAFTTIDFANDGVNGYYFYAYSSTGASPFFTSGNVGQTYSFKFASL